MVNVAGYLSLRITLRLHNVAFLRMKTNGGSNLCLASRDYGSSMPAKYIPKNSSNRRKTEEKDALQVRGLVESEVYDNPNETSVRFGVSHGVSGRTSKKASFHKEPHNDNGSSRPSPPINSLMFTSTPMAMSDLEEEMGHGEDTLDVEQLNGADEIEIPQVRGIGYDDISESEKTRKNVEHKAIQLLATRAFTVAEMKKKLLMKRFPSAIIDSVVDDLRKRGFINDSIYAEAYSQSRWSSSCWGPRRIKHELYKKGVDRVDVDKAVRVVFEGDDSSGYDEEEASSSRLGMSKESLEHLFVQASKQWMRSEGIAADTRKARIIRWLQYRGFNWGITNLILTRLEAQAN